MPDVINPNIPPYGPPRGQGGLHHEIHGLHRDPDAPGHWVIGWEVIDDYTVEINFNTGTEAARLCLSRQDWREWLIALASSTNLKG